MKVLSLPVSEVEKRVSELGDGKAKHSLCQEGLEEVEANGHLPLLTLIPSTSPPSLPRAGSDVQLDAGREGVGVGGEDAAAEGLGTVLEVGRRRERSVGGGRPEGRGDGASAEAAHGEHGGRVGDVEDGDGVTLSMKGFSEASWRAQEQRTLQEGKGETRVGSEVDLVGSRLSALSPVLVLVSDNLFSPSIGLSGSPSSFLKIFLTLLTSPLIAPPLPSSCSSATGESQTRAGASVVGYSSVGEELEGPEKDLRLALLPPKSERRRVGEPGTFSRATQRGD